MEVIVNQPLLTCAEGTPTSSISTTTAADDSLVNSQAQDISGLLAATEVKGKGNSDDQLKVVDAEQGGGDEDNEGGDNGEGDFPDEELSPEDRGGHGSNANNSNGNAKKALGGAGGAGDENGEQEDEEDGDGHNDQDDDKDDDNNDDDNDDEDDEDGEEEGDEEDVGEEEPEDEEEPEEEEEEALQPPKKRKK